MDRKNGKVEKSHDPDEEVSRSVIRHVYFLKNRRFPAGVPEEPLTMHSPMLDPQAELKRLDALRLTNVAEARALLQELLARLGPLGMQQGELRPRDALVLRDEEERRGAGALLARFRQLPAAEQTRLPALLNGLGKLHHAAGDFEAAKTIFVEVTWAAAEPPTRAEARWNGHRTALEQRKWDEALAALHEAATLDPERFAPFPLDRYSPQRILGAGGFGSAFLCKDAKSGESVVVKALHDADLERGADDIFRETKLLAGLADPLLAGARDLGFAVTRERARPYLVFDYFPGGTLKQFVQQRGTLAPPQLLAVVVPIAQAMRGAHGLGLLHRDLRPANVLVRKEGDRWRIKIIDFGLSLKRCPLEAMAARAPGGESLLGQSAVDAVLYAAPEQFSRQPGVKPGTYSDIYSFGKLCCFALFGTTEPKGRQWSTIPNELAEVLDRCTESGLEHRHLGFEPVLRVLETLATGIAPTVAPAQVPRPAGAAAPAGRTAVTGPASAKEFQERATTHLDRRDADRAIADATEALRLDPKCAAACATRAAAYRMKGDLERALADAGEAIRLDPTHALGYFNRAEVHRLKGQADQAIADAGEAIRLDPRYAPSFGIRAEGYLAKGEYEKAIDDATEALKLAPRAWSAFGTRAAAYRMRGQYDLAITDATEALGLNPEFAFAWFTRATALLGKEEFDRAIADASEAVRLVPSAAPAFGTRAAAHLGKAGVHLRKKEKDRAPKEVELAIADATKALELEPRYAAALCTRAEALRMKGEYDRAIADAGTAIRLDPGSPLAYGTRGSAYRLKGDFISAIADLTDALRLDPRIPWVRQQLELAQRRER
jgi:tetratricopeptide (TPR) repeat protein